MKHNEETKAKLASQPIMPPTSAAALEPFPLVEFNESPPAKFPSPTQAWIWGVIEYGTAAAPTESLQTGDVVALDEGVDESVRLIVNGRVVAVGALVHENSRIGIRIAKLIDLQLCDDACAEEAMNDAA